MEEPFVSAEEQALLREYGEELFALEGESMAALMGTASGQREWRYTQYEHPDPLGVIRGFVGLLKFRTYIPVGHFQLSVED